MVYYSTRIVFNAAHFLSADPSVLTASNAQADLQGTRSDQTQSTHAPSACLSVLFFSLECSTLSPQRLTFPLDTESDLPSPGNLASPSHEDAFLL